MKLINKARSLRQIQTDVEHLLWQDVGRNKPTQAKRRVSISGNRCGVPETPIFAFAQTGLFRPTTPIGSRELKKWMH